MDLRAVLQAMDRSKPLSDDARNVGLLCREVMRLEGEAWEQTAVWAHKNEVEAEVWRAKAHTYCNVLGDQEALLFMLDQMGV